MRPLNADSVRKLSKCDRRMLRVSESYKNAIVPEYGGPCRGSQGECREEKMPNCDRRMWRLCKTRQNEIIECCECAKTAKVRPPNAVNEGWNNAIVHENLGQGQRG